MPASDEPITLLRESVAEMKGMLTQSLLDQGSRLTKVEDEQRILHGRLTEQGQQLSGHKERIDATAKNVDELQEQAQARNAQVIALVGVIVAAASFVFQFLPIGP